MADFKGSAQSLQRAQQLEKERQIMKELFREKREKIRKDGKIAISTDKFVRESDDLNRKLAHDTVGLVRLEQFQRIREEIEREEREGRKLSDEERQRQRKRRQEAAARLSFEIEDDVWDDAAGETPEETATARLTQNKKDDREESDSKPSEASETADTAESLSMFKGRKRARLGADPTVKSYFEASELAAAASAALDSSRKRLGEEQRVADEKQRTAVVRLVMSFYDGTDHRFFVDCKRGDRIIDILTQCRQEYGPLRGLLVSDLVFVKENLILPTELSIFEFEQLGARREGNRTSRRDHPLFSFALQKKERRVAESDDVPTGDEVMIETDASRNARICSKTWLARNRHQIPAKYWTPFDPAKHCRRPEQ